MFTSIKRQKTKDGYIQHEEQAALPQPIEVPRVVVQPSILMEIDNIVSMAAAPVNQSAKLINKSITSYNSAFKPWNPSSILASGFFNRGSSPIIIAQAQSLSLAVPMDKNDSQMDESENCVLSSAVKVI